MVHYFKEANIHYFYHPELDIIGYGYGYTKNEAKRSFNIVLEETVRYWATKV